MLAFFSVIICASRYDRESEKKEICKKKKIVRCESVRFYLVK